MPPSIEMNNIVSCQDTIVPKDKTYILIDFSLTVKAATLIFIFGHRSAIPSVKEGKSSFIYNLVKS